MIVNIEKQFPQSASRSHGSDILLCFHGSLLLVSRFPCQVEAHSFVSLHTPDLAGNVMESHNNDID
jgi:hypothetical protein